MTTAVGTIRAVAYTRVSRIGGRDETIQSPEVQLEKSEEYAQRAGWVFLNDMSRACQDLDVSAFRNKPEKRPGMGKLIAAAKRKEFDRLVVYKFDRLGRDDLESGMLLKLLEESLHIKVVSATEPTGEGASGWLMRKQLLMWAEFYSRQLSERVYDAHFRRAQHGKPMGGKAPGWCKREKGAGARDVTAIPEQVDNVRRMVELRMTGHGYNKIARILNSEGRHNSKGGPLNESTIYKYLSPEWIPMLEGHQVFNRTSIHKEQIMIPNVYPAVLTKEEADALRDKQAEIRANPLPSGNAARSKAQGWKDKAEGRKIGRLSPDATHLVSGVAFCGSCGGRLSSILRSKQESRNSPNAYLCRMARLNAKQHPEGGYNISGDGLEDAVIRVLREFLWHCPPGEEREIKVSTAEVELHSVEQKISRLMGLFTDGLVERTDFEAKYNPLLAERTRLQKQVERDRAPAAAEKAHSALGSMDRVELRDLIAMLVERVEAPVFIPGHHVRESRTGLRRFVRVTLRYPDNRGYRTFLAPIYSSRYSGERECAKPELEALS